MRKTIQELVDKKGQSSKFTEKELVTNGELFLKWLKELNFEPKLKYKEDNLYVASYLYWITRIERRVVFENLLKTYNISNEETSRRVFRYLYKRLEHSLYYFALKNRKKIKNIKLIKNNWVIFEIDELNLVFFSGYKLLKALNIRIDEIEKIDKEQIDDYSKKVLITLVDSIS